MTAVAMRPVAQVALRCLGFHLLIEVDCEQREQALKTPASEPISAESKPATTFRGFWREQMLHHHRNAPFETLAIVLPSGPIRDASSGTLPPWRARSRSNPAR
jgi:hypothetical protein